MSLPSEAILKICDRRHANALRAKHLAGLCTLAKEAAYPDFLKNGNTLSDIEDRGRKEWADGEREAYIDEVCRKHDSREVRVYQHQRKHQGHLIPTLYGPVLLEGGPASSSDIHGLLIAYIPCFALSKLKENVPREAWEGVAVEALGVVNTLGGHGVLNWDISLDNIVVRRADYQVFMIDFGKARVREEGEDEENLDRIWIQNKAMQDEEGEVGYTLESQGVFDYSCHRTERYPLDFSELSL